MEHIFTAAAERAFAEAAAWAIDPSNQEVEAVSLLLGLLAEPECYAAITLQSLGIHEDRVREGWPALRRFEDRYPGWEGFELPRPPILDGGTAVRRFSNTVQASLRAAQKRLRHLPQPVSLSTEHVLLGLVAADHEVGCWLREQGLRADAILEEINHRYDCMPDVPYDGPPIDLPDYPISKCEVIPDSPSPIENRTTTERSSDCPTSPREPSRADQTSVLRVIDAAANRAREGLRVVEDFVRFVLDDRHLTGQLKSLRHQLVAVLERFPMADRLAARETQADVGTHVTVPSERQRADMSQVVNANMARLQEALRSLEEFGKLSDAEAAGSFEQLRYRSYTLQRAIEITCASLRRLEHARLYVLIDGGPSLAAFATMAESIARAGADVIQLRDKRLDDRELLARARKLREITVATGVLFIVNDRPDLAVLCRADGVHIGQEELSVKDARTIVGPKVLVGVSTHSIEQARQAVLDGADYLGAGPTFPSGTKQFSEYPGLNYLREVASEIRLPTFAIGGIRRENLPHVLETGITRVAVSGAVAGASDPAAAVRSMRAAL